jgi:hypothetical protein
MRKWQRSAVVAAMMVSLSFGCGASAPAASPPANPFGAISEPAVAALETAGDELAVGASTMPAMDLSGLPAAPWAAAPLTTDAVPGALLRAWATADNRAVCAPIALATAGEARARVSEMIEGGWAVEFDQAGSPGMNESGDTCARCGRGTFGIAGTAMQPTDLASEDAETASPSFADGSHLAVEPPAEGEQVAAAMITMSDQGCVYQVWSFLGEAHVRELVAGVRRIDVAAQPLAAR